MIFWTPTYEVAPTSAEHGARIAAEWARCGLGNIEHVPADFNTYTNSVFNLHDFDIFMIFWRLGRFPLQLYGMAHSSEYVPGSDNPVGIMDPVLDDLLEELKYGLDHDAKVAACHEAQRRMYDSTLPYALSHMLLYSRVYFNAAAPGLMGIVNQPGYGSDNGWTESNWRWEPGHPNERIEAGPAGDERVVIYVNGEEAPHRNPLFVETVYEANVIEPTLDGGIAVHPYDLTDVAWQDDNWVIEGPITETITLDSDIDGGQYAGMNAGDSFDIIDGMKITYNLVDGLYWQDGNPVGADDMEFSLEFLRDNEIPQYITTWQDIVDVQQVNSTAWTVYCNETSQFLVYYWSDPLLSTEVWSAWDGQPLADILAYEPTEDYADTGPWSYPDGPDGQPGTGDDPDPTNIGPKTKMFGTGPFVYDYYDAVGMVAEVHAWREQGANVGYFKTTDEIAAIKTEAFWSVGDVDRNGEVWTNDKFRWGQAYLSHKPPHPEDARWDIAADVNKDTVVDWEDGGRISANWGEAKEYGP